ncbi:receptor ionotropic, NMDA 1 [Seminavis robusta]|uniref:Receptor ionotropic, NMDA 1 n=1 Tax=Seminavis robusta TaxID=568900 RepID=A0A9N8ELS3_9STRA|nr:receptor ionotropic, NMDA 1 [Seminavis robusta]|eukprot:Sro1418_g271020.1 receptor ionotropic, NMDA 1 (618) ;mRNA; r:24601-26454
MVPYRCVILSLVVLFLVVPAASGLGGELAAFRTSPLSPEDTSFSQDVCERHEKYRLGHVELKDALSGMSLRPVLVQYEGSPFFKYSHDTGIDKENPGLLAELLDAVAEKANFTWRDNFGITERPHEYNMTWTDLLLWSIKNYDIAAHLWDHTAERMEQGVTYTAPWYDGSLILIDQRRSLRDTNNIDPLNWTKPFAPSVWGMIVLTVVLSALVYQLIEQLHSEREGRSFSQWFSDNLYLSSINFSQNFEYAPSSFAGRIFGVSMTIWALVITATYTANLASLFVESRVEPVLVDSMEEAVVYGYPVCTKENTNADFYIGETFPKAHRKPRVDEKATYESLRSGDCALAVTTKETWLSAQVNKEYNPACDLEWVGDVVRTIKSGFAVQADTGHKCGSLVRHVLDLHLTSLIEEGFLTELWKIHRELEQNHNCNYDGASQSDRRLQKPTEEETHHGPSAAHRILSSGGMASGGAAEGDNIDADTLTLEHMFGTFLVHWGAMAVAVLVSCITAFSHKLRFWQKKGPTVEKLTSGTHQPVLGSNQAPSIIHATKVREEPPWSQAGNLLEHEPIEFDYATMVAKQQILEAKIVRVEKALNAKMDSVLHLLQRGGRADTVALS